MTTIEEAEAPPGPQTAPPRRLRRFIAELGTFLLIAGLLTVLAFGFIWPWDRPFEPTAELDRYAPLVDGESVLTRQERNGEISFESSNTRRVPVLRALNEWPDTPQDALREALGDDLSDEELIARHDEVTAVETRFRTLGADGTITDSTNYAVRDERGDLLVALRDVDGNDLVLSPPALLVPLDLQKGRRWSSEGKLAAGTYKLAGEVIETGPHTTELGEFEDCVLVESLFDVTPPEGETNRSILTDWLCADAGGVVESTELDADRNVISTGIRVAIDGFAAIDGPEPAQDAAAAQPVAKPPATWAITAFGRLARTGDANEATFPPVYVDAAQPLVLAASYNGDLVAFDPAEPSTVVWRFHTGGTIYSTPAVAPDGTIYVGATDKRVYAIDPRGIYLWSFPTGDNVAATPALAGDVLVVASEDRRVYGLDPVTGAQRWTHDTTDAVVSSPAVVGDTVAIASDGGGVEGLDIATGRTRWQFTASSAIEASLAADDSTIFVAATDGVVTALDAGDGSQRWSAEVEAELRSPPVVIDGTVLVVDSDPGHVTALDTGTGDVTWTSDDDGYVGPPARTDDAVAVAKADGSLALLDPASGRPRQTWETTVADDPVLAELGEVGLEIGPGAGGGAVWFADEASNLYRLGPPLAAGAAQPLSPLWIKTFTDPPYSESFSSTPGVWGDRLVVVDDGANVLLADPATGTAERIGAVQTEDRTLGGPTILDDTMLAVFGETLHALSLPDVKPLWTAPVKGTSFAPPVTDGETVVVAVTPDSDEDLPPARLLAFAASDGKPLWEADVGPVVAAVGVTIADGRAHAAGSAFDLATGEEVWHVDLRGTAAGGVGSDEHGTYAAALDTAADKGVITAVDPDGSVRWQEVTDDVMPASAAPQSNGQVVVTTGLEGGATGRDVLTGELLWSYQAAASRFGGDATLVTTDDEDPGSVWVTLNNGQVVGLSATTGERTHQFAALDFELESWSRAQRPTAVGSTVAVPIGLALIAFEIVE